MIAVDGSVERAFDAIALQQMMAPGRPVCAEVVGTVYGSLYKLAGETMGTAASTGVRNAGDVEWDVADLFSLGIDAAATVFNLEFAALLALVQLLAKSLADRTGQTADTVMLEVLAKAREVSP